ncbi:MAG: PQQ-binding-like beta-propeller repeat protein [Planctomycetaceae bacterium]
MLLRTILTICCLSSIFLVDTASAQLRYSLKKNTLPTKDLLSRFALERGWWGQAVVDPDGDEVLHLTVDDAFVFVQTHAGNTSALDIQTGKRIWSYKFGFVNDHSSPIVTDEDTVYFISGVHLVALNRFTGDEKWMLRLPGAISSQILVDEDQIYFGDITGMFYAIDKKRTNEFARKGELPRSSFDTINWRYRSADMVRFAPKRIEEEIIFVSDDGTMYGLARTDKKQFMHFEGDSPVVAPLSNRGRQLYLSVADPSFRQDKRIFCLDEFTGQTLWQRVLTQPVLQRMIVINDNLFVAPVREGLMMLHADTGQQFWKNKEAVRFLSMTESFVLASDSLNNIVLIDRNTGSTLGRLPLRSFTVRYQNEYTDRLYVSTKEGIVAEIREEGAEFPVFYRENKQQPIDPEMAPNPGEESLVEPEPATEPAAPMNDDSFDLLGPDENTKPDPKKKPAEKKEEDDDDGFFNFQ